MKIDELYFGYVMFDPNSHELKQYNLFSSLRVQHSIARWATMDEIERSHFDQLHFCFGDTQYRCEYEMLVDSWPVQNEKGLTKVDTYQMYVEPNRDYLLSLVNKISADEGKKWLKANR